MKVINVGLELFHNSLKSQNVKSVHVKWRPPANSNARLIEIIDKIRERG